MSDEARNAARRIQAILDGGPHAAPPDGASQAARYAELCAETNRRLQECCRLFGQGQASDAAKAAERTPNLFELITHLEFPRANTWRTLCRERGWPVAELLDGRAIDLLNDGYARHAEVAALAAEFRQAVQVRDAREAVRWLRALAERDPATPAWASQLRDFEALRLGEIQNAMATLDRAATPTHLAEADFLRDQISALESLRQELRPTWAVPHEPTRLLEQLTERRRDRERRLALLTAAALVEAINAADQAGDWARLGPLLAHYDELLGGGFLQPPETMSTVVGRARSRWDEQRRRAEDDDAFEELIAAVRRELADKLEPSPELEGWAQDLLKRFAGRALPDDVALRLPPALAFLQDRATARRRRRTAAILAACTGGVLIVAASAAAFAWRRLEQRWVGEIEQAIRLRDATSAGQLVQTLSATHPLLWRSPRLRALELPLEDLRQEIAANRRQADVFGAQAEALHAAGWSAAAPEIKAVLGAAGRLVAERGGDLRVEQLDRLAALRSDYEATRARRQGETDAAFAAQLEALGSRVGSLRQARLAVDDLRAELAQAAELSQRCEALRRLPGVSPELREAGLGRIATPLQRWREVSEARLQALLALQSATDLTAYLEALAALAALSGNEPALARTAAILQTRPDYLLFAAYDGVDLSEPNLQALAATVLRTAERVGPANPFWSEPLIRYSAHLHGSMAIPEVRAGIQRLARNDLLGRLWNVSFLTAEGSAKSGVLRWPDDGDLALAFEAQKAKLRVGGRSVVGRVCAKGAYYVPREADTLPEFVDIDAANPITLTQVTGRGHCQFLRRLAAALPADNAQLVDYLLQGLLELHGNLSICPYLKAQLLGELITLYGNLVGTPLLPASLTRLRQGIADLGSEVNWLCDRSNEYVRVREKAVYLLLQSALDAPTIQAEQQLAVAAAEMVLWPGIQWAGYAALDGSGRLVLRRPLAKVVWALRPAATPKTMQAVEVTAVADDADLRAAMAESTIPGEPLFVPRYAASREEVLQNVASRHGVPIEVLRRQGNRLPAWPRPALSGAP